MFRKELLTKVHNFIHLNLSISLLLGYVVFLLIGVKTVVAKKVYLNVFCCILYSWYSLPQNFNGQHACQQLSLIYIIVTTPFAIFASAYGIAIIRSQISIAMLVYTKRPVYRGDHNSESQIIARVCI